EADRVEGLREARHEQNARSPPAPSHPEHGAVQATLPALRDAVLHEPPELQGPRGLDRSAAASIPTGPRLAPLDRRLPAREGDLQRDPPRGDGGRPRAGNPAAARVRRDRGGGERLRTAPVAL